MKHYQDLAQKEICVYPTLYTLPVTINRCCHGCLSLCFFTSLLYIGLYIYIVVLFPVLNMYEKIAVRGQAKKTKNKTNKKQNKTKQKQKQKTKD
jgi:hypothetical protein